MWVLCRWITVGLVVVILGTGNGRGRTTFGSIVGNVHDTTDAAVPGAVITVLNEGTAAQRSTITDELGSYAVLNLDAATYKSDSGAAGFSNRNLQGRFDRQTGRACGCAAVGFTIK